MIQAEKVVKQIATGDDVVRILNGVDLTIADGESASIIGASGSGKSTLLGILAGLDVPSGGTVALGGRTITALDEDQRAAVRSDLVGFVFQNFQLLPALTALENVMLPLELKGLADARALAADYLDKVGLSPRLRHYPRQLSGGEQQRVALARAFASRPRVLFADEPTGNLDRDTGEHIAELLFQLNADEATTLVLVTHDLGLAHRCGRQLLLEGGLVRELAGAH